MTSPRSAITPAKVESKRVEVPVLREGEIKLLKRFIGIIEDCAKHYNDTKHTMESAMDNSKTLIEDMKELVHFTETDGDVRVTHLPVGQKILRAARDNQPVVVKTKDVMGSVNLDRKNTPSKAAASGDLHPGAAKMLTALERNYPNTYPWDQVCVLAGIIPGNGYFYGGKKSLLASGLIYEQEGRVGAENGKNINPIGKDEIVRMWSAKLKQPAPDMLNVLFAQKEIGVSDLAAEIGKKPGNGYWYGGIKALRDAGLIVQNGNTLRVTELLQ